MTERATRKVLMSPELMEQWATRDEHGNLLRWDWRQPDGEWWEPTISVDYADNLVAAERAHWHRTPGTYRTEEATEVVVDLPESLSWLADEFPDEVNAIVAAKRARIAEAVRGLPSGVGRVGSRSVSVVDRAAVLAAIDGATPK